MANSAKISIDFQALNLDTITKALKDVNDLSNGIKLPKNVVNQINDLTLAVEAMKASMTSISRTKVDSKDFKNFSNTLNEQMSNLNQRVSVLEDAMVKIGKKQDVSGIVNSLETIKNTANDTTTAINNVNQALTQPAKKVKVDNSEQINSLKEQLNLLKQISDLRDEDNPKGVMSNKKVNAADEKALIEMLKEQIELAEEAQYKLEEAFDAGDSDANIMKFAKNINIIINNIYKLQERYEALNGEGSLADIELFKGGANIEDSIDSVISAFDEFNIQIDQDIKKIQNQLSSVPETAKSVAQETQKAIDNTKQELSELQLTDTKYSTQGKKQITIPLALSANAGEKLLTAVNATLSSIQDSIEPLEVQIALVSGYKTKKNEELISQLQNDLTNLKDKKVKEQLSGLISTIQKQFENKLHLDIEVEGSERATQIVKNVIKGLQDDLAGGLPPIDINAQFNAKTLAGLKKQLDALKFQPIKIVTTEDGDTAKKEVKPIAALKTLIDKVKSAIDEKTDAFEREGAVVNETVTGELKRLQRLYQALVTIQRTIKAIDDAYDGAYFSTDEFVTAGLQRLQRFYEALVTIKRTIKDISSVSINFSGLNLSIDQENLAKLSEQISDENIFKSLDNHVVKVNLDTKSANTKLDNLSKKLEKLSNPVSINLGEKEIDETSDVLTKESDHIKTLKQEQEQAIQTVKAEKELKQVILDIDDAIAHNVQSGDQGDFAGILSSDELQKELAIAEKLSTEGLETSKYVSMTKEELETCLQTEQKWLDKCKEGSKAYYNRLGNVEEIQSYLNNAISSQDNPVSTNAEQSAEELKKESQEMVEVDENAKKAAKAKEEFAKANAIVLQSIKESLSGLDKESKAFESMSALLKFFNTLSNTKSDEKIEKIVKNLTTLSTTFNNLGIEDTTFLNQINDLLQKGEELKSLATILSQSKKKIEEAKNITKEPDTKTSTKEEEKEIAESYNRIKTNLKEIRKLEIENAKNAQKTNKETVQYAYNIERITELKKENQDIEDDLIKQGKTREKQEKTILNLTNQYENEVKQAHAIVEAESKDQAIAKEISEREELNEQISKSVSLLNELATSGKYTQSGNAEFNDLISKFKSLQDAEGQLRVDIDLDEAKAKLKDFNNELSKLTTQQKLKELKAATETSISGVAAKIAKFGAENTKLGKELSEALEKVRDRIKALDNMPLDAAQVELQSIKAELNRIEAAANEAGEAGKSFGHKIIDSLTNANARFIANYLSIQDLIRYIREVATTIKEVDSALTELRKVSDASTSRLQQSFEKSAQTAKELGSSITDVINITSDWARLGYNVDQAEELARVTTLFKTVGDNMTAESASSYLVSTLQGFQMATDEAEHIIDVYNEVANNFAIDTAGIGEALQRSAASFHASNTELEKAVSLVTTTNAVIQDPQSVGTLWKTNLCLNVQKCA